MTSTAPARKARATSSSTRTKACGSAPPRRICGRRVDAATYVSRPAPMPRASSSNGRRAVGVRYHQDGTVKTAFCNAEVLLAAGAIQSPQLLQLSGIGPAALLAERGIPVVADLPGVGENLQDHLQMRLSFECTKPITTNDQLNSWFGKLDIAMQWLGSRSGPLAVGINQGGCFMRALEDGNGAKVADRPDIQFHVATLSADMAGGKVHPYSGFTMSVCQLRPESRGHIRIRSKNPFEPPEMQPNYLATDLDRRTAVAAVKAARAIAAAPAMRPYVNREVKPGADAHDDAALLDFCRNNGATIFHPSGTCKMGNDPSVGARRAAARAWHRAPARHRLLGHAHARVGQHPCRCGDDGGEGGGPDSRRFSVGITHPAAGHRMPAGKRARRRVPAGPASLSWSGRRDSNSRPLAPHASALPGCATPRKQPRL